MHRLLLSIHLLLCLFPAFSQVSSRMVMAAAGGSQSLADYTIHWTFGEPIVGITKTEKATLIAGFQQPLWGLPTLIEKHLADEVLVEVFPNPTTGSLTVQIESPTPSNWRISLLAINGKKLWSKTTSGDITQGACNLQPLPAGFYLLHVQDLKSQRFQTCKIQKIN